MANEKVSGKVSFKCAQCLLDCVATKYTDDEGGARVTCNHPKPHCPSFRTLNIAEFMMAGVNYANERLLEKERKAKADATPTVPALPNEDA